MVGRNVGEPEHDVATFAASYQQVLFEQGDTIPLLKKHLLVGRRESCDIVLRFANVSAHHCELTVDGGYLYIRDLQSRNGVKVNGIRVQQKRLDPGDHVSIAKHKYKV